MATGRTVSKAINVKIADYRFASQRITTEAIKLKAVSLYCAGLSFRAIGALLANQYNGTDLDARVYQGALQ